MTASGTRFEALVRRGLPGRIGLFQQTRHGAIDFAVGEKLAEWTRTAQRSGLQLTKQGISSAATIAKIDGVLTGEKEFFSGVAKQISEDFVTRILRGERRR
jgi:hypothetical protein